jgi:hypothetical protein
MLPAAVQTQPAAFAPSLGSAITKVYREEGLLAFWKVR